jgi:cytochrome c556
LVIVGQNLQQASRKNIPVQTRELIDSQVIFSNSTWKTGTQIESTIPGFVSTKPVRFESSLLTGRTMVARPVSGSFVKEMHPMVRKMLQAGIIGALGLIAMMASYGVASTADDDKVPDSKTIMDKSFKNKDAYKTTITSAVKGEKWEDAQKLAKEWSDLGVALGKNKPQKGEEDSWKDLTKKFADYTKAVYDATDKKDAKAVKDAMGVINKSCGACHSAHKGS